MSESPTTSTTAEYDVGDFLPVGRGKGRGHGRGRGRGRGGGGRRGKRTRRGERLEPDRVQVLRDLREEKKRSANEMIDGLDENQSKKILKLVAEKVPSIILDVAGALSGEPSPDSPVPGNNALSWCVCNNCQDMPTDREKVCCGMRPDLCSSIQPEMDLIILEPLAIQINQLYRNDIFARFARTKVDLQVKTACCLQNVDPP